MSVSASLCKDLKFASTSDAELITCRNRQLNYFAEYIVEAQDMDEKGKFVVIGTVPASETQLVVHGLKDKGNYKFRFCIKQI